MSNNNWIKTADNKPPNQQAVLAWRHPWARVYELTYRVGPPETWLWGGDSTSFDPPTCWQPLPLAPTPRKAREWWLIAHIDCKCGVPIDGKSGYHVYDADTGCYGPAIHVREVLEEEAAPQRQTFEQWWQGLRPRCVGETIEHVVGLHLTLATYRNEALAVWQAAGGAE